MIRSGDRSVCTNISTNFIFHFHCGQTLLDTSVCVCLLHLSQHKKKKVLILGLSYYRDLICKSVCVGGLQKHLISFSKENLFFKLPLFCKTTKIIVKKNMFLIKQCME